MNAIPDALSDVANCRLGPLSELNSPLRSGRLEASATLGRTGVQFRLAESNTVLFTATAEFDEQNRTGTPTTGNCALGTVAGHRLGAEVNLTVDDAAEPCRKTPRCAGFSVEQGVYFGGGVKPIYFKSAFAATDGDRRWATWTKAGMPLGYLISTMTLTPGDPTERTYGLGQGNWTQEGGCPFRPQEVVPLERNGQTVSLQQRISCDNPVYLWVARARKL